MAIPQIYFLTQKQRKFVENYAKGMNGTDAAVIAYNAKNRSTAAVIASENLTKPNILNSIALIQQALFGKNQLRQSVEVWKLPKVLISSLTIERNSKQQTWESSF